MRKILIIIFAIVLNSAFVFAAEPSRNLWTVGQVQLFDSSGGLLKAENSYAFLRGKFGDPKIDDDLTLQKDTVSISQLIEAIYTFIAGNPSRGGYLTSGMAEAIAVDIYAADTAYVFIQPGVEVIGDIYSKSTISGGITMSEQNSLAVSGGQVAIAAPYKIENYEVAPGSVMEWKQNLALKNQIMTDNWNNLMKRKKNLVANSYTGGDFFLISHYNNPVSNPSTSGPNGWKASDYPEGGVWYRNGDLTIGATNIEQTKMWGKGTILVEGDLNLIGNIASIPLDGEQGVGFIVKGNIHIKDPSNSATHENFQVINGTYFAGGTIYADKVDSSKAGIPLYIRGSLVADSFDFSARR